MRVRASLSGFRAHVMLGLPARCRFLATESHRVTKAAVEREGDKVHKNGITGGIHSVEGLKKYELNLSVVLKELSYWSRMLLSRV